MSSWVWALNNKGYITKCYSLPELRGKGRCNHIFFQKDSESEFDFVKRVKVRDKEIKENFKYNIDDKNIDNKNIISGAQSKIYDQKNNIFIKIDSEKQEGLIEDFISNFLNYSNLYCVQYESCEIFRNGKDSNLKGCRSENFIPKDCYEINIKNLLSNQELKEMYNKYSLKEQYEYMMNIIEKKTNNNVDYRSYFNKLLCLDILTMNHDRHIENLTLYRNYTTKEYHLPLCFDNGCCFDNKITKNDNNEIDFENRLSTFINFNNSNNSNDKIKLYSLKDYIEIIDKNNILEFDNDIYDFIENYSNDLYDKYYVDKIKKIIISHLKESEGFLWKRKEI